MSKPTVAILGASSERSKFGNKSLRAHLRAGYEVYPVNPKGGRIEGLESYATLTEVPLARLDRISVYLPPAIGLAMLAEIAAKGAAEVWFNPGSADAELLEEARALGIRVVAGCSIVDLGMSPGEFP
jgi:predicted CoA-binding protein